MSRFTPKFLVPLLLAAAPAIAAAGAPYLDQRHVEPVRGDAQAGAAKAAVCVACHGPNGNAIVPAFPKLAGQRAEYVRDELLKFKRGTRPDSPMTALAMPLTDEDIGNLAVYFAAQTRQPSPQPAPDTAALSRGEALYAHGEPGRGAPPCQGCHGADASGPAAGPDHYRAWPSLRGQNGEYLVQRLKNYRDGKPADSSNDFVMHGVARRLDDASIQALAAYLSSLPPTAP
jgi:cytochrome c553